MSMEGLEGFLGWICLMLYANLNWEVLANLYLLVFLFAPFPVCIIYMTFSVYFCGWECLYKRKDEWGEGEGEGLRLGW